MAAVRASRPMICSTFYAKDFVSFLKKKAPDLCVKEVNISSNGSLENALEEIRQCEILVAANDVICRVLENPGKLKWIQSAWAGVDTLTSKCKKTPGVLLTRNGHGYGQLIGEYVVGQVISWERKFPFLLTAQQDKSWQRTKKEMCCPRPLTSLSIGVLGVGEVGQRVCQMCHSLGMRVEGVTRTPVSQDHRKDYVDRYRLMAELKDVLSNCDYICNALPSTADTIGLLNGEMFKQCETKKSVFINIGRGDIVSEDEMVQALRSGWLGGAILDVFEKEPLPEDSPLWTEPNVVLTPHCSGPTIVPFFAEAFLMNYRRYMAGQDLLWLCDFDRGY